MHEHLAAEQALHLRDLLDLAAGHEAALQVGQRLVDLERMQRGVVPGELHQGAIALVHLGGIAPVADGAAMRLDQRAQRLLARLRHQRQHGVAAGGQVLGQLRQVVGHRAGQEGHLALDQAGRARQRIGEGQGRREVVEGDQGLEPRMRRRQADLQFQHQAVGAPQVMHAHGLGAAQLDHLRLGLDRHGAQAQHIARRGQRSVVDRADAAEAAAEQAAERGAAIGRGQAAQFLAGGAGLLLQLAQADAGLGPRDARAHPAQGVVAAHVEHHAAGQWRGLAVVAGAAAADRDRHAMARAGADQGADLVLGAGARHGIGALVLQLAVEHRAEPGEVLRQPGDATGVGDPVEIGQLVHQREDGAGRVVRGRVGDGVHGVLGKKGCGRRRRRVSPATARWRASRRARAGSARPWPRTGPRRSARSAAARRTCAGC